MQSLAVLAESLTNFSCSGFTFPPVISKSVVRALSILGRHSSAVDAVALRDEKVTRHRIRHKNNFIITPL
jgi:rRNA-processing protein FCF1